MNSFSSCTAINQWHEQHEGCKELLVAYGGMQSNDVEFLLECMTSGSRIFWLEREVPETSPTLDAAIDEERLVVSGSDDLAVDAFFQVFDQKEGLKIVLLNADIASQEDQECCAESLRAIQEHMRLVNFSTGTLVQNGMLWQRNSLRNLPHILKSPGVNVLHDQFSGKPAIVVGAGPSLNESIPFIRDLQDRFLIISTGTALTPLRTAGIKPDLVMAVDGSHLVAKQFTVPCEDLFFAGASIVCPQIPGRFKGEFYSMLDSNPIDTWLRSVTDIDGTLMAGGTVTACGMNLAMKMGCDPIITVGLDLSFSDEGDTHASGTMYDGKRHMRKNLTPVPGNWQEHVYTTRQFKCYIDLVRHYVQANEDRRFVNVTGEGALIEGMKLYRPDDLPQLAGEHFDAYEMISNLYSVHRPKSTQFAYEELLRIKTYLEDVQRLCRSGAMASNRLMMMSRFPSRIDPVEMEQCLREIRTIDEMLEKSTTEFGFLQMSLWATAYETATRARQDDESAAGGALLGHSRKFYQQVSGSARWTRELIVQCCNELGESVTSVA